MDWLINLHVPSSTRMLLKWFGKRTFLRNILASISHFLKRCMAANTYATFAIKNLVVHLLISIEDVVMCYSIYFTSFCVIKSILETKYAQMFSGILFDFTKLPKEIDIQFLADFKVSSVLLQFFLSD